MLTLDLFGCASIDSSEYRQTVLIKSDPPGAKIFDRGTELGMTPAYVRVRRRHHPQVDLKFGDETRTIRLKTHYRWGDSFATNFILVTFAPVGWAMDWMTGNAWRMDDPPEQKFAAEAPFKLNDSPRYIAVAPPQTNNVDSSDTLGNLVAGKLSRSTGAKVLPYESTVALFDYYGSDRGLTSRPEQKKNLFYELKADHVFVSTTESTYDGFVIKGKLLNVYTNQERDPFSWSVTGADAAVKGEFQRHKFFQEYFHVLPNTLFLNLASEASQLSIDSGSYPGRSVGGRGFGNDLVNYISAIGLSHLDPPRSNMRGRWVFDFVPAVSVSKKQLTFDSYAPLEGAEFTRWYVSGGYGGEVGYLWKYGLVYYDLVPTLTWSQISYRSSQANGVLERTSISYISELGYSYFFSGHFVGKLFGRTLVEDSTLWERAIHQVSGREVSALGSSSAFLGVAFGYYFPASLKKSGRWRIRDL